MHDFPKIQINYLKISNSDKDNVHYNYLRLDKIQVEFI